MTRSIIFGLHPVKSLLKFSPKIITKLYIANEVKIKLFNKINILNHSSIPIVLVSKRWLDIKANHYNHQGIIAEINPPKRVFSYKDLKLLILSQYKVSCPIILILEHVTDPRNLGAALRTADAVGLKIVIISKYNSAPINNAIVQKAATGITDNIYLIQVSNLLRVIDLLKRHNFWIIGTSPSVKGNNDLFNHKFLYPMAILFGSEDKGLSQLILNNCDNIIYIPMFGKINSLNISVSIGVVLYEIIRQMNYINR